MDERQRLTVFRAQTQNVRTLENAWRHLNRQINALLVEKNGTSVEVVTKLMALVYSAFAEAVFSRLIHTPYGLALSDIEQIKQRTDTAGVKAGWLKCAERALQRVAGAKSSHGPNVQKKLTQLIDAFIFDPSLIRNKLAHGQWHTALNQGMDAENPDITSQIRALNVIELYRRKHALGQLSQIVEDMIESPSKAHHRDYWTHLTKLEEQQHVMSTWTMEKKVNRLLEKKSFALARSQPQT